MSFYGQRMFHCLSLFCSTSLPLSLAHYPSFTWPHFASALTLAGVPMTVQQELRHQHNGRPTGSTVCDNISKNDSWPVTFIISGLGLDTIIPALPTVELCIIEGELTLESHVRQIMLTLHWML